MKAGSASSLLLAFVLLGCAERESAVPPEVQERRESAYRVACASRQILDQAVEDRDMLEGTLTAADPDTPEGSVTIQATSAVLEFARAYSQHAELRASIYAHLDSAVNHSATPADSARYVQRAGAFATRPPAEGTIEANVVASYDRNVAALLADEDHACNWDFEL